MNAPRFTFWAQQPSQRQWENALDVFAEYLSRDLPLPDIARCMEISGGTAAVLLLVLNRMYGGAGE